MALEALANGVEVVTAGKAADGSASTWPRDWPQPEEPGDLRAWGVSKAIYEIAGWVADRKRGEVKWQAARDDLDKFDTTIHGLVPRCIADFVARDIDNMARELVDGLWHHTVAIAPLLARPPYLLQGEQVRDALAARGGIPGWWYRQQVRAYADSIADVSLIRNT